MINENMNKKCDDFECLSCPLKNKKILCYVAGNTHCKFGKLIDTLDKEIKEVKENN